MPIDVTLRRNDAAPWGFRLIGGSDYGMPLTIIKVQEHSAADGSLQNGDTLVSINGVMTSSLTHDSAHSVITSAAELLQLRIIRGPFDGLEGTGFQPIAALDTDQSLPPSEVHQTPEARSSTASPLLLLPTKPYRPFSTEPITEVPPIEEPIILNPNYHDQFPKIKNKEYYKDTIFKLPISSQYVPEHDKEKGVENFKATESGSIETDKTEIIDSNVLTSSVECSVMNEKNSVERTDTSSHLEISEMHSSVDLLEQKMNVEEVNYLEQMNKELDINKIEETAAYVVDESIEKALTVTEEIKKEIDVELIESSSVAETVETKSTSKTLTKIEVKEESVFHNTVDKQQMVKVLLNENTQNAENHERKENVEMELKTETTTTQNYLEDSTYISVIDEKVQSFEANEINSKSELEIDKKVEVQETIEVAAIKKENAQLVKESNVTQKTVERAQSGRKDVEGNNKTETSKKMSTKNLLAEQRAYVLGLQTIPNIKGRVHSSYHYDLLLKTFFIHLTDVMVALSRFILYEPLSKTASTENLSQEENITETSKHKMFVSESVITTKEQKEDTTKNNSENIVVEKVLEADYLQANKNIVINNEETVKTAYDEQGSDYKEVEVIEKKKISGANMAQRTARKSEELIEKMDALVTEFQKNVVTEQSTTMNEETLRRSRSKSKIEEEVSKESDPLEWLSKIDQVKGTQQLVNKSEVVCKATSAVKETKCEQNEQSKGQRHTEVMQENLISDNITSDKNIYVAIVEAHVYTNKNAIIDDTITENVEEIKSQSIEASCVEKTEDSSKIVDIKESVIKNIEKNDLVEEVSLQEVMDRSNFAMITLEPVQQKVIEENAIVELKTEDIAEKNETVDCVLSKQEENKEISSVKTTGNEQINLEIQDLKIESIENNFKELATKVSVASESIEIKEKHITDVHVEHVEEISTKIETKQSAEYYKHNLDEVEKYAAEVIAASNEETSSQIKEELSNVTTEQKSIDIKENITELHLEHREDVATSIETIQSIGIKEHALEETEKFTAEVTSLSETSTHIIAETTETQEASFTAKSVSENEPKKLTLKIEAHEQKHELESQTSVQSDENNDIRTPTPSTIPPTPLTDEYVFRLEIPLPKSAEGIPEQPESSPEPVPEEHEDLNIVKKKLIPHIETSIERIIYETPLPTPPSTASAPAFAQHGLDGFEKVEQNDITKEEILEIERKSSLLASAIDETIKSIEQYKEDVGIECSKDETKQQEENIFKIEELITNNMAVKEQKLEQYQINKETAIHGEIKTETDTMEQEWIQVDKQMKNNTYNLSQLYQTNPVAYQGGILTNGFDEHVNNTDTVFSEASVNKEEMNSHTANELLGTIQGIITGVEDTLVDNELAKELGKPGMTEEKIAELISGESEMLREAHVMGLKRVLASHMSRPCDDSSVDFKRIKPIIENLKDSEVLKALNDELIKTREEKKKEERKWTTFLQRPDRPVPRSKFGYYKFLYEEEAAQEPYKVKIVKQPKPKVAPDYKPKNFETGPLPWEERAANEPPLPPVPREDPILVPEGLPEYLEAVDPLPESEVPDLEDTGIPLPPPKKELPVEQVPEAIEEEGVEVIEEEEAEVETEKVVETEEIVEEMEQNRMTEQILGSIQNMVDPNASLEQQLVQMRAQLAALAQLPGVIQQTLELVTKQMMSLNLQENQAVTSTETVTESSEHIEVTQSQSQEQHVEEITTEVEATQHEEQQVIVEETEAEANLKKTTAEEIQRIREEEVIMMEEQRKIEKQKKELLEQIQLEQESRQIKQRPTPRVGKPKPVFGPLVPQERPLVLPGGRRWRQPKDAYNEDFIAETLTAQAELIQGKAKGLPYESVFLPYDQRINFMKFEKPPVSLDHLKNSDVYKLVHNVDEGPMRRVDMLTPVVAECDYREKCRSVTPCNDKMVQP